MKEENFTRAKDIEQSLKTIDKLHHIVHYPYPKMFCKLKDKRNGFFYDGDFVSFISLDEQTREELKTVIYETINKRRKELEEEFENL